MANIQYIGNDTSKSERGKVHINKGDYTGCGAQISDNREDWVSTNRSVNCNRRGCK